MLKILYAIQATGNGHISRAMQLLPFLQQYGTVDAFLSGSNSHLPAQLPVKYRSRGVSLFYTHHGGLNYPKMLQCFQPRRVWNEAKDLPVEKYDLVINDFECITALACKMKRVPSINFGHQASFISNLTPRPAQKSITGEWILKKYATATAYAGLHFDNYDSFIFQPIIKEAIIRANTSNKQHVTVYLSHYSNQVVAPHLHAVPDVPFHVFSKEVKQPYVHQNITFLPINQQLFDESMVHSAGIITGAGFETPAEALYMGKKLLCIPISGQYEQLCNAAALAKRKNVCIVPRIEASFADTLSKWYLAAPPERLVLTQNTYHIVQQVIEMGRSMQHHTDAYSLLPDLLPPAETLVFA